MYALNSYRDKSYSRCSRHVYVKHKLIIRNFTLLYSVFDVFQTCLQCPEIESLEFKNGPVTNHHTWQRSRSDIILTVFASSEIIMKPCIVSYTMWWETPVARSCEETFWFDSGWFGYRLSICFSDPVGILEKVRGIFINIALKILTVWVNKVYLTETSQSFSSFK